MLKGHKLSEEHKRKLSEVRKGKKRPSFSEKWRKNMGKAHLGNKSRTGQKNSPNMREKISKSKKGHLTSEETRNKLRMTLTGRIISKESREKMSKARIGKFGGDKHPNWQGGISFEPYSPNWKETLKRSIRERDRYTCQLCGKNPSITVHHINYNKKDCNPNNLVTLCCWCHSKTSFNRGYWLDLFSKTLLPK